MVVLHCVILCVYFWRVEGGVVMLAHERRELIKRILQERDQLSVTDLVAMLQVSRETIRRDLLELNQEGVVRKVHGGAVLRKTTLESGYTERSRLQSRQKEAIALAALDWIEDGNTLFLDVGTTTLELAKLLHRRKRISVFTNSLPAALVLGETDAEVYMTGGILKGRDWALTGSLAIDTVRSFFVDHAFIGAAGVHPIYGITDFHLEEAEVRRIAAERSHKTTVLADSTKFETVALVQVLPMSRVDRIITDPGADATICDDIREAGASVIVADLVSAT